MLYPHPLEELFAQLRYRIRRCLSVLAEQTLTEAIERALEIEWHVDTANVWDDYGAPIIADVYHALGDAAVRLGSRSFDLTMAEKCFFDMADHHIAEHEKRMVTMRRRFDDDPGSFVRSAPGEVPSGPSAPPQQGDTSTSDHQTPGVPVKGAKPEVRHADDFAWVCVGDHKFDFKTLSQRQVVEVLFDQWEASGRKDGASMTLSAIIEKSNAATSRLRMERVFKDNPAMGKLIQRVGKGQWALFVGDLLDKH
jgi:hypothetical protein